MMKVIHGLSFAVPLSSPPVARSLARSMIPFTRSYNPYVIAGLTVRTRPGLMPNQRPVTPSSWTISFAMPMNESSYSSSSSLSSAPASGAAPLPAAFSTSSGDVFTASAKDLTTVFDLGLSNEWPICWRVAITATGIVNIWARAPANAPRISSAAVESCGAFEPLGSLLVRRLMYVVRTNE